MADKDFKVKTGIDLPNPLPPAEGGTGQTSLTNAFNALLPAQAGNANKVLQTDGTNTTWTTLPNGYTIGATSARPGSPAVGDLHFNTELNYFESYTSNGWFPIAAAPTAPTGVTATNTPSGRAFNNGRMTVGFSPNTGGGAPTSFIVTPSPSTSPATFTGSSSPITVTNLASNTTYTYTVQATSPYGTSSASAASAGVVATTVPQAPTLSAGVNSQSADITITPGSNGGSTVTQYSITSSPATTTQTTANTTYNFTGLTDGTAYTFTATATNANGTSSPSAASNSVTPVTGIPDSDFWALAASTVTNTSTSTVTISGIPSGYKHLQLRWLASNHDGSLDGNVVIRFNGDSGSNYSWRNTFSISGSPNTGSPANQGNSSSSATSLSLARATANGAGTLFGSGIADIMDYSATNKNKNIISTYVNSRGATGGTTNQYNFLGGGSWNNTAAITSISFINTTSNFGVNSRFALYGYK